MLLSGIESVSLELTASIDGAAVAIPEPLRLQADSAGRASVSVLVLEMRGLGYGFPLPSFDYREVLYRLGVTLEGVPSWLAVRCDLDRALIRSMASVTIRYPVVRAVIDIAPIAEPQAWAFSSTTDGDSLSATLRIVDGRASPPAVPPRRTFVVNAGRLFEVPWDERAAPERHHAKVERARTDACAKLFGQPFEFVEDAVVHQGRRHFCGAARAFPSR